MRVPGPMPGAGTTRRHAMGLGFKCLKCDKHFTYREELYNHSVQDHMYNPPAQISYELQLDNNKTEFSISEVSFEIPVYTPRENVKRGHGRSSYQYQFVKIPFPCIW